MAAVAPDSQRALLGSGTVSLVLAALISSQLHELAHAVAGLAVGLRPTVLPFAVTYAVDGSARQQIVTAVAGPLFSLVLGVVAIALSPVANHWRSGFGRLFWLWLGHVAAMNFVGYLIIAPFATAGDTGKALRLLGASGIAVGALCLLGVAGQFALAWSFAVRLRAFARDVEAERAVAVRAWSAGTAAVIVLTGIQVLLAPIEKSASVLVLTYGVAVAIFAPMQFIFRGRVQLPYGGRAPTSVSAPGIAVTAVVVITLTVLAATGGITL